MAPLRALALCLACCLPLAAGAEPGGPAARHTEQAAATDDLVPRYLLQDHRGRVLTQESFRGRFQLITFGFTSCPDVCPTTLLAFRNILDALGGQAPRLQAIFITVDPERDSAALLHDYTAAFHPAIIGLSGSPELLRHAADTFRVRYEKVREPGAAPGIYSMDHSTGMYLLDGEGSFVLKFASTASPTEVAARIRELLDADRTPPASSRRGNAPLR
jgi:protein SCO1/2